MTSKNALIAAAAGLLLTAVAGSLIAATTPTRTRVTTVETRLDPIVVVDVPAVVRDPITVPAPVTAPEPVATTVTVDPTSDALAVRTPRPPIVETRSPGRPAPIIPIPR